MKPAMITYSSDRSIINLGEFHVAFEKKINT